MRALRWAVGIMGVLIVVGTVTLVVLVASRATSGSGAGGGSSGVAAAPVTQVVLDEPVGTRIAAASVSGDRVLVRLEGEGPDRLAVVDLRTGRVVSRIGLAR